MTTFFDVYSIHFTCASFAALEITKELKDLSGPTLKEFKAELKTNAVIQPKLTALREEVEQFARKFPLPGFDTL